MSGDVGLRGVCNRIPGIKQLLGLFRSVRRQSELLERLVAIKESDSQTLRSASILQALETVRQSDPRYRDPRRLLAHGKQYWSQNFEDGMIEEIFARIGVTEKTFVEIGVETGIQTNTTALLVAGWSGWWIEGNTNYCETIQQTLSNHPGFAERLQVRQALVSPENVKQLFSELEIPREVDLFSLDIDMHTFDVLLALDDFSPRVLVVEYNAGVSPRLNWSHPYRPGEVWRGTQAFGASLKAFEQWGQERGYRLVGCDIIGVNAFLVREDLVEGNFDPPFTAEFHYEPPRCALVHRWGFPSEIYGDPATAETPRR